MKTGINNGLRKVQLAELKIVDEIIRICNDAGITYYISGGTFIGAVRHQGFIPWDDDADIAMPRDQFDRFLKVAPELLSSDFKLLTYQNSVDFPYFAPKVVDTTVKLVDRSSINEKIIPCWVDIFPLDGMPNNLLLRKMHGLNLLVKRAIYNLSDFDNLVKINKKNRPFYEKFLIYIGNHTEMFKRLNSVKYMDKISNCLKKYDSRSSNYYVNFMGAYKLRSVIPKSVYGEGDYYQFEGRKFFGPKDYDSYLTQIYGDYMTIPPVSNQNKHFTEVLEHK